MSHPRSKSRAIDRGREPPGPLGPAPDGDCIDVWIVEAKGKEAGPFDRYCFAEALSQLFEIPAEPLSALLGTQRKAGHGLCIKFANQLLRGWLERGWEARITLAVLIPLWKPDVIWNGTTAILRSQSYFQRPYEGIYGIRRL